MKKIRFLPYAFSLESGGSQNERFSLVGADPVSVVTFNDDKTTVTSKEAGACFETTLLDPFTVLEQEMERRCPDLPYLSELPGLPFAGGAVGFFGYELAHSLERLPRPSELTAPDMPGMAVGIYEWFVIIDHENETCSVIATSNISEPVFEQIKNLVGGNEKETGKFECKGVVNSIFTRRDYDCAIAQIQKYIQNGDCYQVNLAQRFSTSFKGDPTALFDSIMEVDSAPFSGCLFGPGYQVQSYSPERFLKVKDRIVTTQPIKGTRPRGMTPETDSALARELLSSEKDRAENLMIVDLLRNDIGRACIPGSISVERLFELESFSNVHHLVSTIKGTLRDDISPVALLKAAFPGGSITGAPKIRAMEIINELEPVRRGPYCGAIGYISYDGNLDTNLSIRTLVAIQKDNQEPGEIFYWGGGGIVSDSTAEDEYAESLAKVDFIRRALLRFSHDEREPATSVAAASMNERNSSYSSVN